MAVVNLSHSSAIFSGGNYTQVIQNNVQQKGPWDLLRSAAAPSAFFDAGDYFDAPRCHPNTRIGDMRELRDFAYWRNNADRAKITWLHGAAGAGKSAIARSLCEECTTTNSLLASFFFNRSDESRNNHKAFVATIAYQIYGSIPSQYQSLILAVIERDPLIFTRAVEAQVMALIVSPLHDLFQEGYFQTIGKRLIVIDGLDECSNARAQISILSTIQKLSKNTAVPFIYLIASRPENEIQAFLKSSSMLPLLRRYNLNRSFGTNGDIERFLRDRLQETRDTHPFKDSIPPIWPSDRSISILVWRSHKLFMYASLVVKYVTSNYHHPHKRLDAILELRPTVNVNLRIPLPFGDLDSLYSHIFSHVKDIDLALGIIGYSIVEHRPFSIDDLACIAQLDADTCLAALCDLWSVLSVDNRRNGKRYLQILHKSLREYLFCRARSGNLYINKTHVLIDLSAKCFKYLSDVIFTPDNRMTRHNIIAFFHRHMHWLISDISLSHKDLMLFSLTKCYNTFSSPATRSQEEAELFVELFWDNFFFRFLGQLHTLVGTDYAYLYDHYIGEFRNLTDQHPDVYSPPLTQHNTNKIAALTTALILSGLSESQMPAKVFVSTASGPLIGSVTLDESFNLHLSTNREIGNLIHDAALKCFRFLEYDVNRSSVIATLRYLTWVLPYAFQSSELAAACNPHKPFAYAATGEWDHALSNLGQEVAAAMQNYRQKWMETQPCQSQGFKGISTNNNSESDSASDDEILPRNTYNGDSSDSDSMDSNEDNCW